MHPVTLLQDLAVMLVVAAAATLLCHVLKQPVVLGYLVAGLIVGPHTPPFSLIADEHTIGALAEIGLVLLMFGLGLHFSIRRLFSVGGVALAVALVEIVVMLGLGYGFGRLFGWTPMDSLFLGAILSISSTTIIVKVLEDLRLTGRPFAQIIFGSLIVEDVLAIALLALLSGLATGGAEDALALGSVLATLGQLMLFLVLVTVVGLLLVPRLFAYVAGWDSDEMLLVTALGVCFACALLAHRLEYSVALGAFLAGTLIAESSVATRVEGIVAPVRDMFSAVFFVAAGMTIAPETVAEHLVPVLAITAIAVVGKVTACAAGALAAGQRPEEALRVGMGMAQIGEFSFIIAQLGSSVGVTSAFLYPVTVAVSGVTTFLTPYLIRASDGLGMRLARVVPEGVKKPARYYRQWTVDFRDAGLSQRAAVRRVLRRLVSFIVLDVLLMLGLLSFAGVLQKRLAIANTPRIPYADIVVPVAALVLCLPILVHAVGKQRALTMALSELGVRPEARFGRGLLGGLLFALMLLPMLLVVVGFAVAMLESLPLAIVLLGVLLATTIAQWRRLAGLYTRAQLDIEATLAESPVPERPSAAQQ
jgi:CPA2 family monovalent cation:H+ antiporter-2